jgi:hypothetical protein
MTCVRSALVLFAAAGLLLVTGCDTAPPPTTTGSAGSSTVASAGPAAEEERDGPAIEEKADGKYETFDAANFDRPTTIDNEYFPLKPGTRLTWEGTTVDVEGDEEPHRVVFTVTDLTKVIDGVRTVVCWDQDFVDGELVETEIIFFAQDNDGAVWSLGEYPEEYEDGAFVAAPCWIHGIQGAKAGILVPAKPAMGSPSFSQGWAPKVEFTDRGVVYQVGQETTVPFGTFEDVVVIDEWNAEEPDAHGLKYYARGVGNVRIGSRGTGDKENLELMTVEELSAEDLAKARDEALKLEARAYEGSTEVYAKTERSQLGTEVARIETPAEPQEQPGAESGESSLPGTEEFGLTKRQLVEKIEKVEALIAQCMREEGFEYIAADYNTVRRGMVADKSLPGLSEEDFIAQYGFGVSTLYTGKAPQLAEGYSPGKVGLGERNIQIYKNLSPADQVAYNRALFGENTDATFAVGLEIEDFSRCGGCTRTAIEQVFDPEQLKPTYYNPKDALINNDPRMKAALRQFASEMREKGFDYNHPDDVETDIRERLHAITGGATIPVEALTSEQQDALKKLQEYERRVAVVTMELQEEIFEPVEERIERELYAGEVK